MCQKLLEMFEWNGSEFRSISLFEVDPDEDHNTRPDVSAKFCLMLPESYGEADSGDQDQRDPYIIFLMGAPTFGNHNSTNTHGQKIPHVDFSGRLVFEKIFEENGGFSV